MSKIVTVRTKFTTTLLFVAILLIPSISAALAFPMQGVYLDPRISERNGLSLNWSGYAVTGSSGSVTGVSGSWVVPTVSCSSKTAYAAFWAGIDGFNSNTVEQAGVLAQCSSGRAFYSAWYEFYPNPSVTIGTITVMPGDKVYVSVTFSSGVFTVDLTDGSHTYTTSGTVSGAARSSAECITERPSIGGSITSLANFGTVSFGQYYTSISSTCAATISGVSQSLGGFGSVQGITMVNRHLVVLAQPSPLSTDGSSFTVQWRASS